MVHRQMLFGNADRYIQLLESLLETAELKQDFRVHFIQFGLGNKLVSQVVVKFFGNQLHLSENHRFLLNLLLH